MQIRFHTGHIRQSLRAFVQPHGNLKVSVHQPTSTPAMLLQRFFAGSALQQRLRAIPRNFKNDSSKLLKMWAHQCECVLAQRIRRSQQMFALYARIWEEQALRAFVGNIRRLMQRRAKELMLSAGLAYNWDRNRISEEEMRSHLDEIEYIKLLRRKTIECTTCEKVDKNIIAFCECDTRKDLKTYDGWTVFIEQNDLVVWRRPHASGSFEYKVYGNYKDVTAEDFLSVQMDTAYRKKWDPTAVELEVIERDKLASSNSDIIYWEMQWPRLFANRDYVFKRRFLVDKARARVMLLSKATEHPAHASKSNKFRVVDYWSAMVVKPYTEIDKPGIEFSLTYFDNPGVNIPASVTAWVAYRAMPDFLTRLRAATIKYKEYCKKNKCRSIYSLQDDKDVKRTSNEPASDDVRWDTGFDDSFYTILNHELDAEGAEVEQLNNQLHKGRPDDIENATKMEKREEVAIKKTQATKTEAVTPPQVVLDGPASSAPGAEVILAPSAITQNDQTYWKYLQPTYYIS